MAKSKVELPKDEAEINLPDRILKQMGDNARVDTPEVYKGLRLTKDRVVLRVIISVSAFAVRNGVKNYESNYSRVQVAAFNSERLSEIGTKPGDYVRLSDPASINNEADGSVRFIYKKDNEENSMDYISEFLKSLTEEEMREYMEENNQKVVVCRYYIVDAFNIVSSIDINKINNWFSFTKPNETAKEITNK